MRGQLSSDLIMYGVAIIVFLIGFVPLLSTLVADAKVVSDPITDIAWTMLIPIAVIMMVIIFFMRASGRQPPGAWGAQ